MSSRLRGLWRASIGKYLRHNDSIIDYQYAPLPSRGAGCALSQPKIEGTASGAPRQEYWSCKPDSKNKMLSTHDLGQLQACALWPLHASNYGARRHIGCRLAALAASLLPTGMQTNNLHHLYVNMLVRIKRCAASSRVHTAVKQPSPSPDYSARSTYCTAAASTFKA